MLRKVFCIILGLMICYASSVAETTLKGYTEEDGYMYVYFGEFPQVVDGGIPDDGNQAWQWHVTSIKEQKEAKKSGVPVDFSAVVKTPILWRVLSVENNQALLMSEYVLFASSIHSSPTEYMTIGSDFSKTELSEKLNGEFLDSAFTEEEQSAIVPNDNKEMVSLPDSELLKNKALGFGTNKSRKAWATEYAIRATGAFLYQVSNGNHTPYWTCVQSTTSKKNARSIKKDGSLGNLYVHQTDMGVRPVIEVNLAVLRVNEGSGAKDYPIRLSVAK